MLQLDFKLLGIVLLVLLVNTDQALDLLLSQVIVWLDITESLIHFPKCHLQIHQQLLKLIKDMVLEILEAIVQLEQVLQLHVLQELIMML